VVLEKWLFWFFEALALCVGKKQMCHLCGGKKNSCAVDFFIFFLCRAVVCSGVEVSVRVVVCHCH
jgi:hypothetical protein